MKNNCVRCGKKTSDLVICDKCKSKDFRYKGVPAGLYTAEDLYRKRDIEAGEHGNIKII